MERHERPSAQVGLLRHPPSVNVSGGAVRELACRNDGESVGEGFCETRLGQRESRAQEYFNIY